LTYAISKGKIIRRQLTKDDVLSNIAELEVKFVDLQFTDLVGRLRHVTIPSEMVDEQSMSSGFAKLDGSSVKGFVEIHESDMVLLPDPSTYGIIPWVNEELKTARLICDIFNNFGSDRFSRDPRLIAQRAEQILREEGYTESLWGPEVEFFVFNSASWEVNSPFSVSYKLTSSESPYEMDGRSYPIRFKDGYYPSEPIDTLSEFRGRCVRYLREGFGILSNAHHHEVATAGQCEIDMYRDTLTNMADNVMTYKFVIRNVARSMGMIATTMPKPVFGDNAAGMHVHTSLWKEGKNVFYEPEDNYAEISQEARYFIGGLLEHSRALCAIVAPTTNSYKRLIPGYEAPVYVAWSRSNRSASVRIPVYKRGDEQSKRIEFRTPDPSCNPYLAFAAITAAGLDGIKKKIEPGDPVDQDIYKLTPEKRRELSIRELPGSLLEAVESLMSDENFLHGIFTSDVLDTLREIQVQEYREISARPHPYEFYLYFDR
jgi:glutamine synthetase